MNLTIEDISDSITKLNLIGKMDLLGAQAIDIRFNAMSSSGKNIIVNFEEVSFLASMGIRTLVMGAKAAQLKNCKMVILKPNADVEEVLIASGLDSLFSIVQDMDAAQAVFNS